MREILFRGKRVGNGEFVYGSLVVMSNSCTYGGYDISSNMHIIENEDIDIRAFRSGCEAWVNNPLIQVIPETVGQLWIPSVGIRLFGGDLIEAYCAVDGSGKKTRKCKIIETDRGHSVVVWHKKEWWAYSSMNFTSIEVIGNIHTV